MSLTAKKMVSDLGLMGLVLHTIPMLAYCSYKTFQFDLLMYISPLSAWGTQEQWGRTKAVPSYIRWEGQAYVESATAA